MEVDDIIGRLAWAATFTLGVTEILSVTREAGRAIRQREPRRGDGRKLGSSRRGDLVKPVLSGSKELVAETNFYSNRGPILRHHK